MKSETPADLRACSPDLFEGPDRNGAASASTVFCRVGDPAPKKKWLPRTALTPYFENCFASIRIVSRVDSETGDLRAGGNLFENGPPRVSALWAALILSFGEHAAKCAVHFFAVFGRVIPVDSPLQSVPKEHFRLPTEQPFG